MLRELRLVGTGAPRAGAAAAVIHVPLSALLVLGRARLEEVSLMREQVTFEVYSDPAPQGSKTTWSRKDGSRFTRESSKRVKPFRADVRAAASEAFDGRPAFPGPVELQVICIQRRPASHFGTGRNAGRLKPSAPTLKITSPDLSKIVRAVEDALNGVAFIDDARVARIIAEDTYAPVGSTPRVRIAVVDLAEEVNHGETDESAASATGRDRPGASPGPEPDLGAGSATDHAPESTGARARENEARGGRALADW